MRRKALKAAFPHTLPILTGFAFLGLAYGLYEYLRLSVLLSDADEHAHLWRFAGIYRS